MLSDKETEKDDKTQRDIGLLSSRTAIIVALLAAFTAIVTLLLNYWLVERTRTDIAAQTIALEKIKVDIALSAQKTAESVAKIDEARISQERQSVATMAQLESKKIQLENKKSNHEQTRLTPDIAKLSNDLRPNIVISCDGSNSDRKTVKLECSFKNNGAQRVKIYPKTVGMYDKNQKGIKEALSEFDGESNTILPGATGSNTYTVTLTSIGEIVNQPIYKIEFDAITDQQAINLTRRLASGYITEAELKELSRQGYTINLHFN